jgi:hypothetical protein
MPATDARTRKFLRFSTVSPYPAKPAGRINYLLDARHPDFRTSTGKIQRSSFDRRLVQETEVRPAVLPFVSSMNDFQLNSPRILRAADRRATPWKNGGGLTHEVAVYPPQADLDSFDWRISIAEIRSSGPFSSFAGTDRKLAVLHGQLSLAIAPRWACFLSAGTDPHELPGEGAAYAAPIAGFVTDLNVMTRRTRFHSALKRVPLHFPTTIESHAQTSLILALSPLYATHRGRQHALFTHDAIEWTSQDPVDVAPVTDRSAFYLIQLFRRLPA